MIKTYGECKTKKELNLGTLRVPNWSVLSPFILIKFVCCHSDALLCITTCVHPGIQNLFGSGCLCFPAMPVRQAESSNETEDTQV